ncbi:uncharacterized protein L3040_005720 [Drepanopeziza brunnea f. sp. 'multigermtubi']|uniref:Cytochrome P450 n=1 Tax=Marssonina brunnea f. sp. multigermtubi (strain MB_m1) TaxID=1072389 RepID=K1X0Q7_MARBU|nr:uncharacterized protein MBM_07169 [Drepanopeziza brunnea f. sp. 'multigermtubi' MB_m1]EKD14448.1 hypothetical protein MBM_07169 [Drepanopeziza brunnea f. sp. 'multigermtubi' MB_m1]KAJ5041169.1 hypothetical protein L3040_005720 [Drepanopeziza brunnea f. sp. 'multigermtubi']
MFSTAKIASALALSSLASGMALNHKRAAETGVQLYVYGSGYGTPLTYADGFAYFGRTSPADAVVSTNITFTLDNAVVSVPWTIAANSSTVSFTSDLSMYIIPSNGSFAPVGFSTAADLPTGAVNSGFTFYGRTVSYVTPSSLDYQMNFWANATTTPYVYALYWKSKSATVPSTAFPVVVKSTSPTFLI